MAAVRATRAALPVMLAAGGGVVVNTGSQRTWSLPSPTVAAWLPSLFGWFMGRVWDSRREIREQVDWDSHAAFMDALVDDGFVLLGGPVGYDHGALHLVESADETDVRARLEQDPWAQSGVLRLGSVEPWRIWLGGRAKAQAR